MYCFSLIFQKNQKYFHAIFGDHILLGSVAMWKPLFGNRAPKLPFPFTLPNHWRWWWPPARAWKKKNHQKSEIWEICAGMAQNYHFSSLCRNPRGRGHLVSANQGELSLGLVALLTTTDKKGKFRNVQTWEITTSEYILTGIRLPLLPFLQHWSDHWLTYTHTYWHVLTKIN